MHHQLQKQRQQQRICCLSLSSFNPLGVLSVTFNKRAFSSNSKRACIVFNMRRAEISLSLAQVIHFFRRRISLRLLYERASMCVHAK